MHALLKKVSLDGSARALVFFTLLAVLFGVFIRFYRVDHRLFWQDEVFVVYRASGYTEGEFFRGMPYGESRSFQDLEKYLHPSKSNRGFWGAAKTAREYPHIPPLYETLLLCWIRIFGDSIAAIRSFSVFLSLFVFPLILWFCRELFRSYRIGMISAALLAVSPYHLIYAQEARNYSIWSVAILFSSAALLRAVRTHSPVAWALYGVSLAAGLYSHVFFIFVVTAHLLYLFFFERRFLGRAALSLGIAFTMFSPQLYLMVRYFRRIFAAQNWLSSPDPEQSLWSLLSNSVASLFVEHQMLVEFFERRDFKFLSEIAEQLPLYGAILGAALFILLFWKKAPRKPAVFLMLILFVNALSLVIPDLLWGGQRSGVSRYFMPAFLMVPIAVAFVVFTWTNLRQAAVRQAGILMLVGMFLVGTLSCWWRSGRLTIPASFHEAILLEAAAFLDKHPGSTIIFNEKSIFPRKPSIVYYNLKNKRESRFMRLSTKEPFPSKLPPSQRYLLLWPRKPTSGEEISRWVSRSGAYSVSVVAPRFGTHVMTGCMKLRAYSSG